MYMYASSAKGASVYLCNRMNARFLSRTHRALGPAVRRVAKLQECQS